MRVHLADPAVPGGLRERLERACAGPLPALLPAHPPRRPPPEFHAAYRAEWPPDPGYPQRRPALQLHKLLVNLRHFGDRYVPRIEAVLDGYRLVRVDTGRMSRGGGTLLRHPCEQGEP